MNLISSVAGRRLRASGILQMVAALVLAVIVTGHGEARADTATGVKTGTLVEKTSSGETYQTARSQKRYVTKKGTAKSKASKKRYAKKGKKRYAKSGKKRYAKKRSGKKKVAKAAAAKPYVVATTQPIGRPPIPVARKVAAPEVQVAALGTVANDVSPEKQKSLTGGGVRWVASSSCLVASLRAKVYKIASNYGNVTVNSTCRSKQHNRRVGGARRSQHLTGNAVDFRVHGNWRAAAAFLRSHGGGYKHYGGGRFHIDTGPRRRW